MKKVLIIWSFWTSDLLLDGQPIDGTIFREKTKEIVENYSIYKERISFPILETFKQKIYESKDTYYIRWIFTDQPYSTDTVYLSELIEKKYHRPNKNSIVEDGITLSEARLFQNILNVLNDRLGTSDYRKYDEIYVVPTWWTKGIVAGLFMCAIDKLPTGKTCFFYGEEQGDKTTRFISQDKISILAQQRFVNNLLENLDFDSVITFIETNNLIKECDAEYWFAKYMHNRLNLDYNWCDKICEEHSLPHWTREPRNMIEEKIDGIIYTLKKGRLVEFFGRIYNFSESITSEKIKELYHIDSAPIYWNILQFIQEDPNLKTYLDNYHMKDNSLLQRNPEIHYSIDATKFMNLYVKKALIEYKLDQKDLFLKMLNNIEKLNQYRNKTVIAHENEPINMNIIYEKYGSKSIIEDFMKLLESCTGKTQLWIENCLK